MVDAYVWLDSKPNMHILLACESIEPQKSQRTFFFILIYLFIYFFQTTINGFG